ncbi:hypothetical protein [Shinella zoogloeoides]|uniref:Uncharacterized protein n=1 Tax=Shinella zoogloeoides TaxID=352475 RepID=A0A6N8T8W5_SHIZO|nr:hypothetical protein [Shinella zoogloeoides]MXN99752.1 hypothetical protein [Shinella zoogloeoides]UEX80754.1 hypothetical protein K8M09_14265 [Shinella zoogloeoides]
MKFLPTSFRLSRKLLIILAGVTVLTGASGAAAIFVGRDALLGPPAEEVSGVACTIVSTVRVDRDGQQWLRRYVRSDAKDGDVRIKTALRVAGAVSNSEEADLYQVVLLDAAGPTYRADMRGRAIGAEVLFSRDPSAIPGMTAPFVARYTDGTPAANGEFYGERKELSLDEIKTIVTAMKEREDCVDPNAVAEAGEGGGHGEAKKEAGGHEAPAEGEHASAEAAEGSHEVAASEH